MKSLVEISQSYCFWVYYVYVIKDIETDNLYYGYTADVRRRINEHNRTGCWELVYYEAYKSEFDARKRERGLKHYGQAITALKTRLKESLK